MRAVVLTAPGAPLTVQDIPEPVAPAMSRCGILARSATTTFPSRSLPNAMGSAIRAC